METQTASTKNIAVNYGVLMALLSITLQVIAYVMDALIERPWWLSVGQMAITIGVVVMGIRAFKKENGNLLSFVQALKVGVGLSLVAGIILAGFNYILIHYIDPDMMPRAMEMARQQLEANPDLTQEQVEFSMSISEKFSSFWIMSAISILGALFFGFVISLITGLAIRTPTQHHIQ